MSYETALKKSWDDLSLLSSGGSLSVRFLNDEYNIDIVKRAILSLSCNVPAKNFMAVLILHYLVKKLQGLPILRSEWVSFKELSGIEGYSSAFRKRAIEPIIHKYGKNPHGLLSILDRFHGIAADGADAAVIIDCFEGVPLKILLWGQDDEFDAEAGILFDRSIGEIFSVEDIVVLAGIVAEAI